MKTDATQIIEQLQAEAYQNGWDDLANKIRSVLGNSTNKSSKTPFKSSEENPFETDSGSAKIYDYVKANPGLRGRDIIKNTGIDGKNVRTTLHRMKTRSFAVNEGGKWRIL